MKKKSVCSLSKYVLSGQPWSTSLPHSPAEGSLGTRNPSRLFPPGGSCFPQGKREEWIDFLASWSSNYCNYTSFIQFEVLLNTEILGVLCLQTESKT